MKITIQIINGKMYADSRVRIMRRILKLETYYNSIITASVILRKDNESRDKGCHVAMRLMIKGYDLLGKSKAGNFEKALSLVIESMRKRLQKIKTVRLLKRIDYTQTIKTA